MSRSTGISLLVMAFFCAIGLSGAGRAADEFPIDKKAGASTIVGIPPGVHAVYGRTLHQPSDDCAEAKIDLWVDSGRIEYVISAPGQWPEKANLTQLSSGARIRLGRESCRISVEIVAE